MKNHAIYTAILTLFTAESGNNPGCCYYNIGDKSMIRKIATGVTLIFFCIVLALFTACDASPPDDAGIIDFSILDGRVYLLADSEQTGLTYLYQLDGEMLPHKTVTVFEENSKSFSFMGQSIIYSDGNEICMYNILDNIEQRYLISDDGINQIDPISPNLIAYRTTNGDANSYWIYDTTGSDLPELVYSGDESPLMLCCGEDILAYYMAGSNEIFGYNYNTGTTLALGELPSESHNNSCFIYDGKLYILCEERTFFSVDVKSGVASYSEMENVVGEISAVWLEDDTVWLASGTYPNSTKSPYAPANDNINDYELYVYRWLLSSNDLISVTCPVADNVYLGPAKRIRLSNGDIYIQTSFWCNLIDKHGHMLSPIIRSKV